MQVTRLGVAVVLAHLLSPHDYGIAGMVLVFLSFVLIFSDFALGSTLIQRRDLTEEECSTAFWTSVASGTLFTSIGIAAAAPVADFFGEPSLRPMIMVLSLSFLIQSLGITQSALLMRAMAFRDLEIREMAATLVGGAVGIGAALRGAGAWAIISQQLAAAIATTLLVWHFTPWWPQRMFSWRVLRGFARFSTNVFGTNIVVQLRGTTDNLLIGRVLGPAALGAYGLAYNLVLVPFNRIAAPLSHVLFPALSRIQDDRSRIGELWMRSLRLITAVAAPCTVGLVVAGPDFIKVVLGDKWHQAAPIVQLLAVVGLLQTLQFLNPFILQAIDRTGTLVRWTLFSYGVTATAFVVGLQWGVVGVAAAYVIASCVTEPLYARATARALGVPLRELARAISQPVQASLVMAAGMIPARLLLAGVDAGASVRLPVLVATGVLCAGLGIVWRAPAALQELKAVVRRRAQAAAELDPAELITSSNAAASSPASSPYS